MAPVGPDAGAVQAGEVSLAIVCFLLLVLLSILVSVPYFLYQNDQNDQDETESEQTRLWRERMGLLFNYGTCKTTGLPISLFEVDHIEMIESTIFDDIDPQDVRLLQNQVEFAEGEGHFTEITPGPDFNATISRREAMYDGLAKVCREVAQYYRDALYSPRTSEEDEESSGGLGRSIGEDSAWA